MPLNISICSGVMDEDMLVYVIGSPPLTIVLSVVVAPGSPPMMTVLSVVVLMTFESLPLVCISICSGVMLDDIVDGIPLLDI